MKLFERPSYDRDPKAKKKEMPIGLWTKCTECGEVLFNKDLERNLMVCPKCQHHMPISARDRIFSLCDEGSFIEKDATLKTVDVLNFTGTASYTSRLETYQKKTGLTEAVVSGVGKLSGKDISIAVMDFAFLGGSMGSVVGEKITRTLERAIDQRMPAIVISASGGARMYEGMLSLMQLAKTSAAVAKCAENRIPFISILTNPTMAGVMASFASLGDVILAEPKAMIGFAGARVIRETTRQELPKGFQTAEFLMEHGLIDHIVSRNEMKNFLTRLLAYLSS